MVFRRGGQDAAALPDPGVCHGRYAFYWPVGGVRALLLLANERYSRFINRQWAVPVLEYWPMGGIRA
jgi:hypothetical protein